MIKRKSKFGSRVGTSFLLLMVVVFVIVLLGLFMKLPFWDDVVGVGSGAYLAILALILGDAVFPLLPGETTLNTASVAASSGKLSLGLVIAAGGLGATIGDSCVYWIARSLHGSLHAKVMNLAAQPRSNAILKVFKNNAPLMIVFGRYIPGLRLVVNVTMGSVVRLPYRHFLPWSAFAGFLWSAYTCLLAYAVATVLHSDPFISVVISGMVTSVALLVIGWMFRRSMQRETVQAKK